ncbi:DUF2842 domain-containing protein [Rhodobacteraceae bacterium NNCM2]|nr:DUF2842 domain-containing protein [Coraliihabitans acroporae]
MSYKTRKLLCVVVLFIGLPLYIFTAATLVGLFDRLPFLLELLIYVVLGVLWALPLRRLFRGIGRADPGANDPR